MSRQHGKPLKADSEKGRPASRAPTSATAGAATLNLQNVLGNRALGNIVQTKLRVGRPGDRFEREADANADKMQHTKPSSPCKCGGKCSKCAAKAAAGASGLPVPDAHRAGFERVLGRDLSFVRLHTDTRAAQAAASLNALAFTNGPNIYFGAGQYSPDSTSGRRLLAHEVTHAVQQSDQPSDLPHIQRQEAPQGANPVTGVRISCPDMRIVFDTADTSYAYTLENCSVPQGVYSTGVSVRNTRRGREIHWDFGTVTHTEQQFNFAFRIEAGQVNPATLFRTQRQVTVAVVDRLPPPQSSEAVEAPAPQNLSTRLAAFKRLVRNVGKLRLESNRAALEQWREFLNTRLTPTQVRRQVVSQEVQQMLTLAEHDPSARFVVEDWLQTAGPNRRWVQEQQAGGRLRACSGCHAAVQADTMDRERVRQLGEVQLTPLQQLNQQAQAEQASATTRPEGAPATGSSGPPGGYHAMALAQQRIAAIAPFLQILGPSGYHVLPPETLGSTASAPQLVAEINRRIDQRQADYRALARGIDSPDFDYLKLRPIVRDLLATADPDVRRAVEDEISDAETWETIKSIVIGAATLALLVLAIFPPTSFIGIAGTIALGATVSAVQIYEGLQTYDEGRLYSLGRGANDVFDPAQQQAADTMMAMGAVNIVMGSIGLASSGLSAVRLIRAAPVAANPLGALESVEATAGSNNVRITGMGAAEPQVTVTGPGGQTIRQGPLSSFQGGGGTSRGWTPRVVQGGGQTTPPVSANASGTSVPTGGPVYQTQGTSALAVQPQVAPAVAPPVRHLRLVPEPVPAVPPVVAPPTVTPPVVQPPVPVAPNVRVPLTTTAVTAVPGAVAVATGAAPARVPVMPPGLSPADRDLWFRCRDLHDQYKATQDEAAAFAGRMDALELLLQSNRATPQDRLEFCRLLDERMRIIQRLRRERLQYINLDCDRFDWFNSGTTAAERLARHQQEVANVGAQMGNLYALRGRFCS